MAATIYSYTFGFAEPTRGFGLGVAVAVASFAPVVGPGRISAMVPARDSATTDIQVTITVAAKPDAAERAALATIQRRMPSRDRIQTIIDRRPARDPWLDDSEDWDL